MAEGLQHATITVCGIEIEIAAAVDLGYQVVVPSDAVVGVPVEYGESVMENTISLLATVVATDDVVDAWS